MAAGERPMQVLPLLPLLVACSVDGNTSLEPAFTLEKISLGKYMALSTRNNITYEKSQDNPVAILKEKYLVPAPPTLPKLENPVY